MAGTDISAKNEYSITYDDNGNATMIEYAEGVSDPVCGVQKNRRLRFTLKVVSGIKGYKQTKSSWINKKTLQICYRQKKGKSRNEITIRKARGKGDISGVHNKWKKTTLITVNGKKVKLRGNTKTVSVATWRSGKYTYSVVFLKPVRVKTMINLVKKIK